MELISSCCSAPVYENNDFCSDCMEHCGAIDINSENDEEYEFTNQWIKL